MQEVHRGSSLACSLRWLGSLPFAIALVACQKEAPPEPPPNVPTEPTKPAAEIAAAEVAAPEPSDPSVPTGWRKLAPPGEGFTISFPSEPDRQVNPITGPQGHKVELIQYLTSSDDQALVVSVAPLVAQLVEHGDPELALDRTLATQTDQPGRTVRYKKTVTLADAKGREAELDMSIEGTTARMRIRIFLQGLRIFQMIAMWPNPGETPPAAVDTFFDSFALTNDTSAVGAAVDLWRARPVPELGLELTLPSTHEVATAAGSTFMGDAQVTTMTSMTSFPASLFTVEAAQVPPSHADKSDADLLGEWRKAKAELGKTGEAPAVTKDTEGALLDVKGVELEVRTTIEDKPRDGLMRAIVQRKDGKATTFLIASVWTAEAKDLPEAAKRFYEGMKRLP